MNTHEACALLGVPIGASDLDVKTAFKRRLLSIIQIETNLQTLKVSSKRLMKLFNY